MNNLYLIIWLCLFPLCSTLEIYIIAKRRKMTGEEPLTSEEIGFQSLINLIILIIISYKLW